MIEEQINFENEINKFKGSTKPKTRGNKENVGL